MEDFNQSLAKLGFVWQFITLAGFHADGLITTLFARSVSTDTQTHANMPGIHFMASSPRHQIHSHSSENPTKSVMYLNLSDLVQD